ncbi:MAG: hypothetical protein WAL38_03395 [Solirubrobacteraceae bacterium]
MSRSPQGGRYATGVGRATASTTLSKLAKGGELTKAERGYRLTEPSKPSA